MSELLPTTRDIRRRVFSHGVHSYRAVCGDICGAISYAWGWSELGGVFFDDQQPPGSFACSHIEEADDVVWYSVTAVPCPVTFPIPDLGEENGFVLDECWLWTEEIVEVIQPQSEEDGEVFKPTEFRFVCPDGHQFSIFEW